MQRHKPLERKTPLKAGKPLARKAPPKKRASSPSFTAPVKNAAAVKKARPAKRASRTTGPSIALRRAVHRRDRGRCIVCGKPATNIQHRRARGMGGSEDLTVNRLSLLLSVCGTGTTGCHGDIESNRAWARQLGYAVRRNSAVDPEQVPVKTWEGWRLFLDDGRVILTTPPGESDAG